MSTGLSVVGYGMVTAVATSGPASCAALWAQIRHLETDNLFDVTTGEPLSVGRPTLHQWWEGRDMLAELAAPAIEECTRIARALSGAQADQIPVLQLVAPAHRPWRWQDLEQLATSDLEHKLGRALPSGSKLLPSGRTGMHAALTWAGEMLHEQRAPFCIVVGVESFMRQILVNHYAQEGRVLGKKNSNGFSPGEAAAAVLIARADTVQGPQLHIRGSGFANDPSGAGGNAQHPVTGKGLTQAIRQALQRANAQFYDLELRFSDSNGEHFKFREVTLADTRLSRIRPASLPKRRVPYFDHWHPSEYIGEVGAAIGPLLLGYAFDAGYNGHLPGPLVLLHASEDNGDRNAMVVEYQGSGPSKELS